MQQTLLVTVQGTQRKLDVELPDDVPVGDLIPLLLEMCSHSTELAAGAGQSKTSWMLQVASLNQPLGATKTLSESGVLDGDILLLQAPGTLSREGAKIGEKGFPRSIEAGPQTGMIGVTWEKGQLF